MVAYLTQYFTVDHGIASYVVILIRKVLPLHPLQHTTGYYIGTYIATYLGQWVYISGNKTMSAHVINDVCMAPPSGEH